MSDYQIVELFDSTNITMRELSRLTGRPIQDLKALLMSNRGN
jgi:predicted HTH domain antitoxin